MKVTLKSNVDENISALAAKVCRGSGKDYDPEVDNSEIIKKVVGYGHESIMEHVYFTFLIEGISRVVSHQLVRHRIASYSQESQRHVKPKGGFGGWYVIPESIRKKPYGIQMFNRAIDKIVGVYNALEQMGIPKEDARFILPNATRTSILVTMNARTLMNFFEHRICNRAQWEIKRMATMMLYLLKKSSPILFEDWEPKCGRCKEPCEKELNTELDLGSIESGHTISYEYDGG